MIGAEADEGMTAMLVDGRRCGMGVRPA